MFNDNTANAYTASIRSPSQRERPGDGAQSVSPAQLSCYSSRQKLLPSNAEAARNVSGVAQRDAIQIVKLHHAHVPSPVMKACDIKRGELLCAEAHRPGPLLAPLLVDLGRLGAERDVERARELPPLPLADEARADAAGAAEAADAAACPETPKPKWLDPGAGAPGLPGSGGADDDDDGADFPEGSGAGYRGGCCALLPPLPCL